MPDFCMQREDTSSPRLSNLRRLPSRWLLQHRAAICVYLLFSAALLYPLLLGRVLYWGDIALYFEPMQQLVKTELQHGRVPLWNPYILCGQPLLGNPQMAVFYPFSALSPGLSASVFLSAATISHVFMCGLFMYLFLLRWSVSRISAIVGGLTYMGSACIVSRVQFPPIILSAPYAPLLLLGIDRVLEAPHCPRRTAWLAVITALLVLAAHPQVAYLSTLLGACYGLWRLTSPQFLIENRPARVAMPVTCKERHRSAKTAAVICLSYLLGVGTAAIQLVPMLQLMVVSTREHMTPYVANRFVFDLSHLATLVFPGLFGHPASGDYHGGGNAWEPSIFIGWLPLTCVLIAMIASVKVRVLRFWSILGLINIWLATGIAGGLFFIAFYVIPGLSAFHDPARFLFLTTICMCVLTAAGCDTLLQRKPHWNSRQMRVLLTAAAAAPLILYGIKWNPTTLQAATGNVEASNGRTYMPAHDVYWQRFITDGYTDYGADRELAAMRSTGISNTQESQHLETAAGYEPVPLAAQAELDGLTRIAFKRGEPTLLQLVHLMDTSELWLPTYHSLYNADFKPMQQHRGKDIRKYAPAVRSERAWLVRNAIEVEGKIRTEAVISSPDFDPTQIAVVSRPVPRTPLGFPEVPLMTAEPVQPINITRGSSGSKITLIADAGRSKALAVVSVACCPGWHATIDGNEAELLCADGAFMAVAIPPGKHLIQIEYQPAAVKLGAFLSLVCVSLLAGAFVYPIAWGRKTTLRGCAA
jgi:Bacterial membrane protein YfhO